MGPEANVWAKELNGYARPAIRRWNDGFTANSA
jgi:hypothetical protein